jgi:hypothetical protein
MKRLLALALGGVTISALAFAQANDPSMDRALAAAPRNLREGATVIKFNPDGSYETLRKGSNRLLCFDRSGEPGRQPFAVQCTSIGNLERVKQNRKFEAMTDTKANKKGNERSRNLALSGTT